MYTLINKNGDELDGFPTLDSAMQAAKTTGFFVTIKGPGNFEVCGVFGVDSVQDGKTPDGQVYDWNKASRIGRIKKEEDYGDSSWDQD
jgi:hypothetical protein